MEFHVPPGTAAVRAFVLVSKDQTGDAGSLATDAVQYTVSTPSQDTYREVNILLRYKAGTASPCVTVVTTIPESTAFKFCM